MADTAASQAKNRQQNIAGTGDFDSKELAEKVYDMIMADIEPDLLSYNIDLLDEYYADESADERKARMERYELAYKEFDRAFEEFMQSVQEEVRDNKRTALRQKEEEAREEEIEALSALENAFS